MKKKILAMLLCLSMAMQMTNFVGADEEYAEDLIWNEIVVEEEDEAEPELDEPIFDVYEEPASDESEEEAPSDEEMIEEIVEIEDPVEEEAPAEVDDEEEIVIGEIIEEEPADEETEEPADEVVEIEIIEEEIILESFGTEAGAFGSDGAMDYTTLYNSVVTEAKAILDELTVIEEYAATIEPEYFWDYGNDVNMLIARLDAVWAALEEAETSETVTLEELDILFDVLETEADFYNLYARLNTLIPNESVEEDWIEEVPEEDWVEEEYEEDYIPPVDYTQVAELQPNVIDITDSTTFSTRSGSVDHPNIVTSKTIEYDAENGYTLRLESYLTGDSTVTERIPSDIVMVLDQSGSMDFCFECGDSYDSRTTQYSNMLKDYSASELYDRPIYIRENPTDTEGTRVYYCQGTNSGKCVFAGDAKKVHTAGSWYANDHTMEKTLEKGLGQRYLASVADGSKGSYKARRLYTDEKLEKPVQFDVKTDGDCRYYVMENPAGTSGYAGEFVRALFCSSHGYWHKETDIKSISNWSATNCTLNGTQYIVLPVRFSGDALAFAQRFFYEGYEERSTAHVYYKNDVENNTSYLVRTQNNSKVAADIYEEVSYCSTCQGWHTLNNHNSKLYQPKANANDSAGVKFFLNCRKASPTRNEVLVDALNAFVKEIYEDTSYADAAGNQKTLNHRIAIVGFASGNSNEILSYSEDDRTAESINYAGLTAGSKQLKQTLHDVSEADGRSIINSAIENILPAGSTEVYAGMDMANWILKANPLEKGEQRNRIVVVFTDGAPSSDRTPHEGANDALIASKEIKDSNVSVYTIGVFSGADASNMAGDVATVVARNAVHANKFMHLLSSNFPTATNLGPAYNAQGITSSYYLSAGSQTAIDEIFKLIAKQVSQGTPSVDSIDASTIIKDVVSEQFELDDEGTRLISLHTEQHILNEYNESAWMDDNDTTIDSKLILLAEDPSEPNKVQVSGFDFNEHYVAVDTTDGIKVARGRKVVIQIPIKINSENKGGNDQVTNVQNKSGIYQGSICLENFDLPHVDIPTTVTVTKTIVGGTPEDFQFEAKGLFKWDKIYTDTAVGTSNYLSINTDPSAPNIPLNVYDYRGDNPYTFTLGNKTDSSELKYDISDVVVGSTIYFKEATNDLYDVEVKVGNEVLTVEKSGTYSGYYKIVVEPNMTIKVTNTYKLADLTIKKDAKNVDLDEDQSFIFHVEGIAGTATADVDVTVVVVGSSTVTIPQIPVGDYTVTENTDWSWRYTLTDVKEGINTPAGKELVELKDDDQNLTGAKVYLPLDGNTVTFTNTRPKDKWLSGDCYVENWFSSDGIKKRNGNNEIISD